MTEGVRYRRDASPSAADVAALYRAAGLRRPVDDERRIARMIEGSDLIVTARYEGRLVGVARTITDGAYCAYLSDLAVHPDVQRQGVGKELIRRTREALGPEVMLILLAAPSARDYYGHIGFDHADNCWIIPRER